MNLQPVHPHPGRTRDADAPPTSPALSEPILLIHGTAANRRSDDSADWWHPGSEFSRDLDSLLQQAGVAARCWAPKVQRERPFAWTGENSEIARRDAGRALAAYLVELEADASVSRYHLVAHSHGGNVMVNALHEMVRTPGKLGAAVFLGTPALAFRHPQAFDERWLSVPVYAAALAGSIHQVMQPGNSQFLWIPVIVVVTLALLADLLRSGPPGRRAEAELYGSGMPSAFAFAGDEAIRALLAAQQIVQEPKRFIDQFTQTNPARPFAYPPVAPPKHGLWGRLEHSGAFSVMRWLKLDSSTQQEASPTSKMLMRRMPRLDGSTREAARPTSADQPSTVVKPLSGGDAEMLRNAAGVVDRTLVGFPMWREIATLALWAFALLPLAVLVIAGAAASTLSWCASVLLRRVVLGNAMRLGRMSLPVLVRKAAFGEDAGKFMGVRDTPPGVASLELIPEDLARDANALGAALGTDAGQALLHAVTRTDAFAIKTEVENALGDTALVHSHYYRAPLVKASIAKLIAQPKRPQSAPSARWPWNWAPLASSLGGTPLAKLYGLDAVRSTTGSPEGAAAPQPGSAGDTGQFDKQVRAMSAAGALLVMEAGKRVARDAQTSPVAEPDAAAPDRERDGQSKTAG